MAKKDYEITVEEGLELIRRLKTEPEFWCSFVKLEPARNIFNAKMRSCNINRDYYGDMVDEMYIHLFRNDWAELDKIQYPEKFWGWFSMKVRTHFGFSKDNATGEYKPKKALRELLPQGTANVDYVDIDSDPDKDCGPVIQLPASDNTEERLLRNDRVRQFNEVLDTMRRIGRKGFPMYAEVIERVILKSEDRVEIALDLARRGLIRAPYKNPGEEFTAEETIRLRDNLNNNIYKRARDYFNQIALFKKFECQIA